MSKTLDFKTSLLSQTQQLDLQLAEVVELLNNLSPADKTRYRDLRDRFKRARRALAHLDRAVAHLDKVVDDEL